MSPDTYVPSTRDGVPNWLRCECRCSLPSYDAVESAVLYHVFEEARVSFAPPRRAAATGRMLVYEELKRLRRQFALAEQLSKEQPHDIHARIHLTKSKAALESVAALHYELAEEHELPPRMYSWLLWRAYNHFRDIEQRRQPAWSTVRDEAQAASADLGFDISTVCLPPMETFADVRERLTAALRPRIEKLVVHHAEIHITGSLAGDSSLVIRIQA